MEIISYLTNADYKIETKDIFQRSKHSKLHSFLLVLHSGVFHLSLNCIEYNIVLFFCKKRTYIQMYLWNIIFHMWNMKKKLMDWVELTTYEFLFHVCFFTRDVLCDISENHLCTLNDIQFVNNNICGKLNFSYVKTKISLLQKQKDISFYSWVTTCCCILWPPCERGHGKPPPLHHIYLAAFDPKQSPVSQWPLPLPPVSWSPTISFTFTPPTNIVPSAH